MCIDFKRSTLLKLRIEGRFLWCERPSWELASHGTRRARTKAQPLSQGPEFNFRSWQWRCLEQTSWLLLSRREYCDIGPIDNAKLFPPSTACIASHSWYGKNRRLSFLTPPPLWIEFPGDFFAGLLQAPSLFDHRRLLIYGLYVYSFCKCKVISTEWSEYEARKVPDVSFLYVTK